MVQQILIIGFEQLRLHRIELVVFDFNQAAIRCYERVGFRTEGRLRDIVGSLCENNDKFAIDRPLPRIDSGDLLVIHDAGAHGHAMGFQYNGKLRSAELLLKEDGRVQLIRRAETLDDYFATLDFAGV